MSNRLTNDDELEDNYITAYHQLIQTHHQQQQQQMLAQQEQENMLSTIFEASCEEATPMTSMIDVHQQRTQQPSPPPPPLPRPPLQQQQQQQQQQLFPEDDYVDNSDNGDNEDDDDDDENTDHQIAPSFAAIDDMPVSTMFSRNESKIHLSNISYFYLSFLDLKYTEYVLQKIQTEVNTSLYFLFKLTCS